ncbi:MAG TPA: hypothetical protein PLH27_09665 [bacterium]|nr:hypothetical protein [bacterium]HMY37303.1 hypothetical protein [bacterium]HMZ04596.1 hypothetical protein [bacterium]HNB09028.1 hypothetical protein [bacterium]HNB57741.1 hypothetical protein [bacterium]
MHVVRSITCGGMRVPTIPHLFTEQNAMAYGLKISVILMICLALYMIMTA